MCAKRSREDDGAVPSPKKARHGFRVGPENLPDGPWRRKVTKIKKELITKAKVKKQYAKVKAEHEKNAAARPAPVILDSHPEPLDPVAQPDSQDAADQPTTQIHPQRQAMLDTSSPPSAPQNKQQQRQQQKHDPDQDQDPGSDQDQEKANQDPSTHPHHQHPHRRRQKRPDYYSKQLAAAEKTRKEAEARAAERARREEERQHRLAERERYRKAMAKAKAPGRDGKRKVGREGKVLLERVRKMVGDV